jgi:hypothetical protein
MKRLHMTDKETHVGPNVPIDEGLVGRQESEVSEFRPQLLARLLPKVKSGTRKWLFFLKSLVLDYADLQAKLSVNGDGKSPLTGATLLVVGVGIPLFSLINHLTPIFNNLLDFRLRTLISAVFCVIAIRLCYVLVTAKAETWGSLELSYAYARSDRTFAKTILPIAAVTLSLIIGEIRLFYRPAVFFGGKLHDKGKLVAGSEIKFLDRDGKDLCTFCSATDFEGEFFAELRKGGRAVELKTSVKGSTETCQLKTETIRRIYEERSDVRLDRTCRR